MTASETPKARTASARPRIAVTCGTEEPSARITPASFILSRGVTEVGLEYTGGVEEAGGLPFIVPIPYRIREGLTSEAPAFAEAMAAEILEAVDGVLFTGGEDIDPETFGEGPLRQLGSVEPARDLIELALARAALARGIPVLGICRGIQLLAIAAGGALYQDLGSQKQGTLKHRQSPSPRHALTHFVTVQPGTLLAGLLGSGDLKVNSFHHQAVSRVPEGFVASAAAPDGVIEAIEAVGAAGRRFVLGVQWHPENLWSRNPEFLGLFRGLVEAAAHRRAGG